MSSEKERDEGPKGLSRRSFLKGAAAVGAVAAVSAALPLRAEGKADAVSGATAQAAGGEGGRLVNPETPPEPIPDSAISATLEADVVIVGAGVAGMSAARAASEAGASVIVVEKATTYQYRSGQFGSIDNKVQKKLGIKIDKNAALTETMKQMGYRADQRLWKYWADNSGSAFDWLLELAPDLDVIPEDALAYDESKPTLQVLHFPLPKTYDPKREYSPSYPTVLTFLPDMGMMMERVYKRCQEKGCKFIFSTWARQLIRPENKGRVRGLICQDAAGAYTKILAKKGVILATGDFGSNKDMIAYYTPWALGAPNFFPNKDAAGVPTNTGDGQRMGSWVGGKMEDGPLAPMTHTLGGPLGVDAFFLANAEGERFCNEDVGGQQLSSALYRQPGFYGWQIFDDKWPEQLPLMGVSHGAVNHCVPDAKNPKLKNNMAIGRTSYISREELLRTPELLVANSVEELVAKIGIAPEARKRLLASIARYNELCKRGVDEDFGKTERRMFPIRKGPFYAAKVTAGAMLVCMGGLVCDHETGKVLDRSLKGIEGLYAAGNAMGGRFVVDYPVVTAGASHGMALTFGRMVGDVVAKL